ncbi:hypothetical protein OGAPHI_004393 [Ogataea philodendri]|uniref:NADH:ubiquinone reductase (non-electrogenic) n=2 Tax=Saccharomycotina TaxID=147537 RepID=A0A9P8P756_9ASCO|nr:uncharacterized protein OGAPHI_004393 [Ogataea philodendri]KAH3666204.1 hypothetical protein OGAPHI_004393 [Ogataea philodendri]
MIKRQIASASRRVCQPRLFSSFRTVLQTAKPVEAAPKKPAKKAGFFAYTLYGLVAAALGETAYLTYAVYKETNPGSQLPQSTLKENGNKKKNVVILGSGWGAISYLHSLDTTQYNVTIVSPRNYFLFTPLLPSVPTSTVGSQSICDPVRAIARQTPGEVTYLEAAATDVDPVNNTVHVVHKNMSFTLGEAFVNNDEPIETTLNYDYLIYAVGAKVNTFGIPGIPEYASYLKEAHDATAVRQKLFNAIEASRLLPKDSDERKRLLTFVVCGGGPTGVELAAEVKDYIDQDLHKFIPDIEKEMKVVLVEALPNVLNMFPQKLIEYTKEVFNNQGVELRTNTMVKKVDPKNVYASVKRADGTSEDVVIPYGTLVWAGGNAQRQLTRSLADKITEQKTARRGLLVDENLKLDGASNIYALGDCTFTTNAPTAQVAHQQGEYLADYFNKLAKLDDLEYLSSLEVNPESVQKLARRIERQKASLKPFVYKHQGAMAYVGSERAIADLSWGSWSTLALGGSLTFFFWRTAYVSMILGVRSKILVVSDWIKVALFGRDCSKD